MDATNTSITGQLEGFIASAKKLEDALTEERKRSQKIAHDYLSARTTLESAVRELQGRLAQRENKIAAVSEALRNSLQSEERIKNELRELTEREKKVSANLAQYQSAWNEVLAREAEARNTLIEHEKTKRALAEANQKAATHSRQAETYRGELQSALGRIQAAEAKFHQAQKELAVLTQNKRNVEEEISRIENRLREHYAWELAGEKERLRAELEKNLTRDRERVREIARNQIRTEVEKAVGAERNIRQSVQTELEKTAAKLRDIEAERKIEMQRARSRLLALTEENDAAKKEILNARNDLAVLRMEAGQYAAQLESTKKETNKTLLMERIRLEGVMTEMREKVEQLMTNGIYAEKVDHIPEGNTLHQAYPVDQTASDVSSNEATISSLPSSSQSVDF